MLIDLSFIFFYSFACLFIVRKFAKQVGLVDKPSSRKQHEGQVPIAGGIAICIILSNLLYTRPSLIPHSELLLVSIVILTLVGSFDDKFDLSVYFRLGTQLFLSGLFIYKSNLQLNFLGDLLGSGNLYLGRVAGGVVTILAIVGAINAFNMIDGLDGLLGILCIVAFTSLAILLLINLQNALAYLSAIMVVSILPYVFMNLGILGRKRKVFMGDAGSMMMGFIVIWLLINASQGDQVHSIRPITAVWIIALPLMDMVATIIRRLISGRSPFRSDQDHIHFILQRMGLNPSQTLFVITGVAFLMALFGIVSEIIAVPDHVMFATFMSCFLVYFVTLLRLSARLVEKTAP